MTLSSLDPSSRLVVETVLRHGPIPRVGVVQRTGLSFGSVTRLTTPLVAAGILAEQAPGPEPRLGRPALPLTVVDRAARFIGIKIIPGRLHAVLTGLAGQLHETVESTADTSTPETTARAIATLTTSLRHHDPEAIGVALAAAVAPDGQVRAAPLLSWREGNLERVVSRLTGLPCKAANDVDVLTLAEHWVGHGRGLSSFAVVTVGAGVGAGAVSSDELVIGHQGAAGMVGQAWTSNGTRFHDALADEPLRRAASAAVGRELAAEELDGSPDPRVHAVLDAAAHSLGELLCLVKLTWGPQRILVTGEGITHFTARMHLVEQVLVERRFEDIDPPELVVAPYDIHAWARGAAALATRLSLAH